MTLLELLAKHITHCHGLSVTSFTNPGGTISIGYDLKVAMNVPMNYWISDKEDMNRFILTWNNKQPLGTITKHLALPNGPQCIDRNIPLPNNKKFVQIKTYNIKDLLDKDVTTFFYKEREEIFKEVKGKIVLDKMHLLSQEWEILTSPDHFNRYMDFKQIVRPKRVKKTKSKLNVDKLPF